MRVQTISLGCSLVGAALLLGLATRPYLGGGAARPGPRTIAEVIARAERLGLYHGTDEPGGVPFHRVVVGDRPVTREHAGTLRLNDPRHPAWIGTASVYAHGHSYALEYDPECSAFWGTFFVYGDPELVRRLTDDTR